MIWSVPEIIHELSLLYALAPGDLIYTGTPAGVGPLLPGDTVRIEAEGVGRLQHRVVEALSESLAALRRRSTIPFPAHLRRAA